MDKTIKVKVGSFHGAEVFRKIEITEENAIKVRPRGFVFRKKHGIGPQGLKSVNTKY